MQKRIFYFDVLRCFAMAMVLLLHSISSYIVQPGLFGTKSWYIYLVLNALARTGVPLFFMISGGLLLASDKTEAFGEFYRKRLPHLALPLLFWNAAYFGFKVARGYIEFDLSAWLADLLNCGSEYHLWYLYTLIGLYLLAPFLRILVRQCTVKQLGWLLFLMLFCSTIRPFINTVTPLYLYLFDPLFNGYAGCFLLGYLLSQLKNGPKCTAASAICGILGLAGSVVLNHVNSSAEGVNLVANNGYSFCHYLLAASIFLLARSAWEKRSFLPKVMAAVSRCSFGVYLLHAAVMDLIVDYLMIDASPIFSSLYIFVLTLIISLILSFALNRIKFLRNVVS